MSVNPPPRYVPQNRLTQGMDLVGQYNAMYPPRAAGGTGIPQEVFQSQGGGPPTPAISPEEAARREAQWTAETGQMLDERGNVVQAPRSYPQGQQFAANPGVIRRAPEPLYQGHPGAQYPAYPMPGVMPQYGTPGPGFQEPIRSPRMAQATPGYAQVLPFTPVQAIQSIDLEHGVVYADGRSFPFDLSRAQQVIQFALGVIANAYAEQLGSLLQRYGLVVTQAPGGAAPVGNEALPSVPNLQALHPLSPRPQGPGGATGSVQAVPRGEPAGVSEQGAVPEQVPQADEGGAPAAGGDSAPTA